MAARFDTGTINISRPTSPASASGLKLVAQRVEDGLVIELTSTQTGYDLEVVLRGRALTAAVSADFDANYQVSDRKLLARYDRASDTIATHPTTLAIASPYFLRPKYEEILTIKFEGFGKIEDILGNYELEALTMPSGFVKDPFAGFGVHFDLRFIVGELEAEGGFNELVLSEYFHSRTEGTTAHLTYSAFDKWRRAIRRSHLRAVQFGNSAKRDYLRNALGREFNLMPSAVPVGLTSADLADSVLESLNLAGRQPPVIAATHAVRKARENCTTLAASEPELLALNREIELLTLEGLITRFEDHLAKRHAETFWQKFLSDNPFIIRLAFGLPIAIFGEQVAVGGMKFDGSGGKIADYLLRAGANGNLAIIEIKKPDTYLVNTSEYRGGVYAPHKEISGAVTQVLDQRYQLQMEINNKKVASGQFDVFTYAMQGLVIAGRDLDDSNQRKSFELFRNGLKDVAVVTFTELLMKLKALLAFLTQETDQALLPTITLEQGDATHLVRT